MKDQFKKVMKVVGKVAPIILFISVVMLCTIVPVVVAKDNDKNEVITTTSIVTTTTTTNTTKLATTTTTVITTKKPTVTTTTKKTTTTTKKTTTTTKPTEETTIFYEATKKTTTTTKVSKPKGKYDIAQEVWSYMKDLGWNDYVCAGVMGNLMAETGGQTLNLKPSTYSSGGDYYGICQWSTYYFPEVEDASLSKQLSFMAKTIKSEINMFSDVHGYTYNSFLQIQDEQTAAKAFAAAYERCDSSTYSVRMKNASVAYAYFVG